MTFTQAQAESLFIQVMDLQSALVRRGELHPQSTHGVLDGRVTAAGEFLTECTCGRGMFRATSEESQADYALHVANAIGLRVRMGRAA